MYVLGMNKSVLVIMAATDAEGGIVNTGQTALARLFVLLCEPQLTSCFSALEMTAMDIQSGRHRLETTCQPGCDGSGIAGCGMYA